LIKNKIYWLPLFAILALVLFVKFSNAEIINNNDASKNETNIYKNMNVTFSNSWTVINSSLDSYIFSINQGNGFVNSTPIQINQSTNISVYSLLISADPGAIIYWRFFANDSNNSWANSGLQDFTISQYQYPSYITSSIGTNETIYTNKSIEFRSSWTDDKKLDSYIFSINQGNGFVNSTPIQFISNGDYTNISINKTYINSLPGTTVYWIFFANDSSNNWNSTPIQSYVINSSTNTTSINTSANQTIIYESQSFIFDLINPGVEAVFQTDKSKNLDINKILVSVYSPMHNITLSVQRIQELPSSIKNPNGTIILSDYIIQQEGIPNEKLKSIKIDFFVPKSFLSENNVSYNAVNLYRYYNDKWTIIHADKIGEDKLRVEFLATSAGTSYFLIGIEKPVGNNELIQDIVNNGNVSDTNTPYDIPYSKKSNKTPWIIATLIAIVTVILGYIFMKKRNKKT
jgi:PGF-pre-PGF domain-containing protein